MKRKLLFVDRDGCLLVEPADQQVDSYGKFNLVPGVIGALRRCAEAGYELVMVSNQDGLGTESFPQEHFVGPQNLLLRILASEGIVFREVLIDCSFEHEGRDTRKPGCGMLRHYLADDGWSRTASVMVGDRETDMQFAANLGVRGFRVGPQGRDWAAIAHELLDAPRTATVLRETRETRIKVHVDLDRKAEPRVRSGLEFLDHMLQQFGKHGGFALELECTGDLGVDEHHTVEDCALTLGEALRQALDDKRGVARYGFSPEDLPKHKTCSRQERGCVLPMDDALASAVLDISGRPYFTLDGRFPRECVGDLLTELVGHFFRSLCDALGATLHLRVRGDNAHHMVEACFKCVARALRQALMREGSELPSTKGMLA